MRSRNSDILFFNRAHFRFSVGLLPNAVITGTHPIRLQELHDELVQQVGIGKHKHIPSVPGTSRRLVVHFVQSSTIIRLSNLHVLEHVIDLLRRENAVCEPEQGGAP